jgi:hypothetical protein
MQAQAFAFLSVQTMSTCVCVCVCVCELVRLSHISLLRCVCCLLAGWL